MSKDEVSIPNIRQYMSPTNCNSGTVSPPRLCMSLSLCRNTSSTKCPPPADEGLLLSLPAVAVVCTNSGIQVATVLQKKLKQRIQLGLTTSTPSPSPSPFRNGRTHVVGSTSRLRRSLVDFNRSEKLGFILDHISAVLSLCCWWHRMQ